MTLFSSEAKGDKKTHRKQQGKCAQHIVVWTTKLTFSALVRDMQFSEWVSTLHATLMCMKNVFAESEMGWEMETEKELENMHSNACFQFSGKKDFVSL